MDVGVADILGFEAHMILLENIEVSEEKKN
jgi:hypothetical protein